MDKQVLKQAVKQGLNKSLAITLVVIVGFVSASGWSQDNNSGPGNQGSGNQSGEQSSGEQPEQTWTVNFKDTDIEEVIKFVAGVTGKTIVLDPRVKGRVKVISSKPVNRIELYNLFRDILELHDFALVEVGDVVRIIPLKDARSSPIPVGKPDERGYVTEVYQLKNVDAAKILPVLRPLIPQHSHMASDTFSNSIVVSDTAANIARLIKVIEKIDQSASPETEVVQLRYADAEDLVATLTKLTQKEAQQTPSSNQLQIIADKRNNAILLSGEDLQRLRAKKLILRLDRPPAQSGNVRVIYLNYAKAKDVAEILSRVVQNMQKSTPGGGDPNNQSQGLTVEADEDTNALLITGTGDMLNSLMAVIDKLDVRRAQVLIEAIIVKVDLGTDKGLGVDYLGLNSDTGIVGSNIGNGGTQLRELAGGALQGGDAGEAAIGQALTGGRGLALSFLGAQDGTEKFAALLTAFQSDSNANILSTPSVLTMDNNEASISVGQEISIATGSFSSAGTGGGISSPFQTSQREDVGILLTVTPQVNEGNKILLTVVQEVSSISGTDPSGQPITDKSEINTQILANDGQVVVLGGLIEDNVREQVNKVPILGSIPLLGYLFKSTTAQSTKTNLMVFLRAKIMRDDESMYGATSEKYEYMQGQQLLQRERGLHLMSDKVLPVLPEITVEDLYKQSDESDNSKGGK